MNQTQCGPQVRAKRRPSDDAVAKSFPAGRREHFLSSLFTLFRPRYRVERAASLPG